MTSNMPGSAEPQTCIQEVFARLLSDALEVLEGNIMVKLPFVAESACHFRSYDALSVFACGYALGEGVTQEWVAGRRSSSSETGSMHSHNGGTGTSSRSSDGILSTRLLAEGWSGSSSSRSSSSSSSSSAATRQTSAPRQTSASAAYDEKKTKKEPNLLGAKETEGTRFADKWDHDHDHDHDHDLASLVSAMDHPLTGVKLQYKTLEEVSSTNACPSYLACFSLHDAVEWLRLNGWDDKAAQASKRLWSMLEHGCLRYTCLAERFCSYP
jgi:hypothetical protein